MKFRHEGLFSLLIVTVLLLSNTSHASGREVDLGSRNGEVRKPRILATGGLLKLVDEATLIVQGEITGVKSYLGKHGIESLATLTIFKVLKGSVERQMVLIWYGGGTVNGTLQWDANQPYFVEGESATVLLRPASEGQFRVVGGRDGRVELFVEPGGGEFAPGTRC